MALAASITTDMSISYVCACVRACGQGDGCYVCAADAKVSCVCVWGGGCIKLAVIGLCHSEQGMQSVACHVACSGCGLIW
jgi:hypothetical protein